MEQRGFVKNGFIIKSFAEQCGFNVDYSYFGIGRYTTWPLDFLSDRHSVSLTNEAIDRWFGYQDNRLWVVPDFEYLQRYVQHCNYLDIKVFCLQIESMNRIITTNKDIPIEECLGYDYVDVDMSTSCLHEDLNALNSYVKKCFYPITKQLNKYGLIDSLETMQYYLSIRKQLKNKNYDMEEYYCPTIVRISKAKIE